MTDQPTLFGDTPATEKLGPAQQAILTELREQGHLDTDEAGAILHERRGKHNRDTRCHYCAADGQQVLASLRKRGLATKRRAGGWTPPGPKRPVSPSDGGIPY